MSEFMNTSRFALQRVGYVADVQLGKMLQNAPYAAADIEVPYMRAGHLSRFPEELPRMWASPVDRSRFVVHAGDLVVAEGGDVGRPEFVPQEADGALIQNSLHRVRSRGEGDLRYLRYALLAVQASDWFDVLCNRSTFGHLTVEKLTSLRVPVPAPAAQRVIADFLDTETARIDALITKKRHMIELVAERLRTMVDDLTAGPSMPLRRLVTRFVDYRGATPEKADEGVPLVTASHIKDGQIRHELDPQFLRADVYEAWMRRGFPSAGDVVMTTEAPLGEVAQLRDARIGLAQRVILLTVDEVRCDSTYLSFSLRSSRFRGEMFSQATGSTALGIKADRLKGLPVCVPAVDEQVIIGRQMVYAEDSVRRVRSALAEQVRLLQERRQALITAAVTGELEIPGVAV